MDITDYGTYGYLIGCSLVGFWTEGGGAERGTGRGFRSLYKLQGPSKLQSYENPFDNLLSNLAPEK